MCGDKKNRWNFPVHYKKGKKVIPQSKVTEATEMIEPSTKRNN